MPRKIDTRELIQSKPMKKKKQCLSESLVNKSSKNSSKTKDINNEIKIFCNTLETEPNYFLDFAEEVKNSKISDVEVSVIKTQKKGGKDPLYAVNYAVEHRGNCKNVWVVFDKDHYNIEKAITLAHQENIKVAWSNECFELWILMHFNLVSTALSREDCFKKAKVVLKKNCNIDYFKNNKEIYKIIKDKTKMAISHSKYQHQKMKKDGVPPNKANPCNTVYELAEFLHKRIL